MAVRASFDAKSNTLTIQVTGLTEKHVKEAKMSGSGNSQVVAYQQYAEIEGVPENLGTLKFSTTVIRPIPKDDRKAAPATK